MTSIAIEDSGGDVRSIHCSYYNHEYNKRCLRHYRSWGVVNELIKLGDLYMLGATPGYRQDWPGYAMHFAAFDVRNMCLAYHRDRGDRWEVSKFRFWDTIADWVTWSFEEALGGPANRFVFRLDNKWWWSDAPGHPLLLLHEED